MEEGTSYSRIVTDAIKDFMKRNAQQVVPGVKEIKKGLEPPPKGISFNYTMCKKQAYKELEKSGYILKYANASRTIAAVVDYKTPENIGHKIADKIFGVEDGQEKSNEMPAKNKGTPEKKKPAVLVYINKTNMDAKCCEGIGNMILGIAGMPKGTKIEVMVKVRELQK